MSDINITLEEVRDRTYFTKLALQRYNIAPQRLRYLIEDREMLETLDDDFVDVLVRCFAQPEQFPKTELATFPLPVILDYLKRTHVLYVYKRLPEIAQSIHILQSAHESTSVLLLALDRFFKDYSRHLIEHIESEEISLFMYVSKLLKMNEQEEYMCKDKIQHHLLDEFEHNHSDTERDLRDVRKLLRAYLPDKTNQTPYRVLMNRLRSFELDLSIHSRIEEEVLLPKARKLQKSIELRCES